MSRASAPWSWTLFVVVLSLLAQGIAVFNPDFVVAVSYTHLTLPTTPYV